MTPLPQTFPTEAFQTLFSILRDGSLDTHRQTAFNSAWEIIGFAGNLAFDDRQPVGYRPALTSTDRPATADYPTLDDWKTATNHYLAARDLAAQLEKLRPISPNGDVPIPAGIAGQHFTAPINWITLIRILLYLLDTLKTP